MAIKVHPKSCMQDEPCNVIVTALPPHHLVTLTCHLKDHNQNRFFSFGHFISSGKGELDLSKSDSIGGGYVGCVQMGLISTLIPEPGQKIPHLRFFKKHVDKPDKIEFLIYCGHLKEEELLNPDLEPLDRTQHYRYYMAKGVVKQKIDHQRVRGTLFLPSEKGTRPGIIDLYGTAGGLLEYRAALLASRGFVTLALAYMDYEDLPPVGSDLQLSYFKDAVDYLINQPKVFKNSVGVIGLSMGGELALAMAAYIPEVKVVVAINSCCAMSQSNLWLDDKNTLPHLPCEMSRIKVCDEEFCSFRGALCYIDDHPQCRIPIELSDAHVLLIAGEDDQNMLSDEYAMHVIDSMVSNCKHNFKMRSYHGAGHLIEPPYTPLCRVSYHKAFSLSFYWGGAKVPHMQAQIKAWNEILSTLNLELFDKKSKL